MLIDTLKGFNKKKSKKFWQKQKKAYFSHVKEYKIMVTINLTEKLAQSWFNWLDKHSIKYLILCEKEEATKEDV